MVVLYCLKCRADVPMLDESEFAALQSVHRQCTLAVKRYQEEHEADHVMKHRVSLHGAVCGSCGQPLRTPHPSFCAACGLKAN